MPIPGGSVYQPGTGIITTPLGTTIKHNGKAFTGGWAGAVVTLHGTANDKIPVGQLELPGGTRIDLKEDKAYLPNGNIMQNVLAQIQNGEGGGSGIGSGDSTQKPNGPGNSGSETAPGIGGSPPPNQKPGDGASGTVPPNDDVEDEGNSGGSGDADDSTNNGGTNNGGGNNGAGGNTNITIGNGNNININVGAPITGARRAPEADLCRNR